ncbi:MAG: LamG-like jellyroll fold domain-containing protein [Cytophagaceae bacterium]
MEAWIYPLSYAVPSAGGVIFSKHETKGTREYDMYLLPSGLLRIAIFDNSNTDFLTSSTSTIPINTWTHVAGSYSGGIVKIYINGILDRTNNIGNVTIAHTATPPLIGAYWLNATTTRAHFDGYIDEVRLWHNERTLTEIRDNMCRSIYPQSNLIANYRLDETSGLIASDASGNGNDGTLENFPIGVDPWYYSGAPIGDESSYWYDIPITLTLNTLPTPNVGSLTIDNYANNPTGFHLFKVNHVPSRTTGISNPINGYFGTFIVNGPITTYRITYDYSGTVFDDPLKCENRYLLKQRDDNSIGTWTTLTSSRNIVNNTLIAPGSVKRKEIILDTTCGLVLPLNFISFVCSNLNSWGTQLSWTTTNEKDVSHFEIERSIDAITFEIIDSVFSIGKESDISTVNEYTFIDVQSINTITSFIYYRIKQIDKNGSCTYSKMNAVHLTNIKNVSCFYDATNSNLLVQVTEEYPWSLIIYSSSGAKVLNVSNVTSTNTTIPLDFLTSGVYYIYFHNNSSIHSEKLIIK